MPGWKTAPPKDDQGYFDRMSKTIFTAGLNWRMVENKWDNFQRAFADFAPAKVAELTEKDVKALMKDTGIVRNERKIRATIQNAQAVLAIEKEFGSVREYLDSFGKKEEALQKDLQLRFKHLGPSTGRMFLWSVGHPLTPNREEKKWMKGHGHKE
jgi:3-methyladenine DNA glycosylase Tag